MSAERSISQRFESEKAQVDRHNKDLKVVLMMMMVGVVNGNDDSCGGGGGDDNDDGGGGAFIYFTIILLNSAISLPNLYKHVTQIKLAELETELKTKVRLILVIHCVVCYHVIYFHPFSHPRLPLPGKVSTIGIGD